MSNMKSIPELHAKIEAFAALLEQEQNQQLKWDGEDCGFRRFEAVPIAMDDLRVTQINVGALRRFVVRHTTGEIYDVEGHRYGTLETIFDYWWGGFYPKRLAKGLKDTPLPVLDNPKPVIPRRGGWAVFMAEHAFRA